MASKLLNSAKKSPFIAQMSECSLKKRMTIGSSHSDLRDNSEIDPSPKSAKRPCMRRQPQPRGSESNPLTVNLIDSSQVEMSVNDANIPPKKTTRTRQKPVRYQILESKSSPIINSSVSSTLHDQEKSIKTPRRRRQAKSRIHLSSIKDNLVPSKRLRKSTSSKTADIGIGSRTRKGLSKSLALPHLESSFLTGLTSNSKQNQDIFPALRTSNSGEMSVISQRSLKPKNMASSLTSKSDLKAAKRLKREASLKFIEPSNLSPDSPKTHLTRPEVHSVPGRSRRKLTSETSTHSLIHPEPVLIGPSSRSLRSSKRQGKQPSSLKPVSSNDSPDVEAQPRPARESRMSKTKVQRSIKASTDMSSKRLGLSSVVSDRPETTLSCITVSTSKKRKRAFEEAPIEVPKKRLAIRNNEVISSGPPLGVETRSRRLRFVDPTSNSYPHLHGPVDPFLIFIHLHCRLTEQSARALIPMLLDDASSLRNGIHVLEDTLVKIINISDTFGGETKQEMETNNPNNIDIGANGQERIC
ncbi:unnamed protein product [Protopolystoma xenopodis]|uniref:Uncharacterized protein n=1 Tax=Protopolystoma xenopodis TaxID=117903 RepID=A0A3S5CNQ0_9PLAT|nr:unnamed protein product [Protopolystoma xenopodis]